MNVCSEMCGRSEYVSNRLGEYASDRRGNQVGYAIGAAMIMIKLYRSAQVQALVHTSQR